MKHNKRGHIRKLSSISLVVAAGLLINIAGCTKAPDESSAPSSAGLNPTISVGVEIAKPVEHPFVLDVVGQAEGSRVVQVKARVSGLLEQQLFSEGEIVAAGKPLFLIDRVPFELALKHAKADVLQRQNLFEQSLREVNRLKPLAEKKAVSKREYDDALSAEKVAKAALDSAKVSLEEAELNLSYTTVTSPISGFTDRAYFSVGNLVNSNSETALTSITQADPIWVRFSVSESEAHRLKATQSTNIQLVSADGNELLKGGRLNFSSSEVDPQLGTVQIRAEFSNPEHKVMPGQFAKLRVEAGKSIVFKVPQVAVVQTEQGNMLWIAREHKATIVPVETAEWNGSDWIVAKGLQEGDAVIVDNLMKLSPDAAVTTTVVESDPTSSLSN